MDAAGLVGSNCASGSCPSRKWAGGLLMDRRSALAGRPLCKNTLQAGARPIDERWVAGQVCQLPVAARGSTPPQVTGQMVNLPTVAATTQGQKQQAERANVPCLLRLAPALMLTSPTRNPIYLPPAYIAVGTYPQTCLLCPSSWVRVS